MSTTVLHLKNHLILIRGENVLGDTPKRFYAAIDGKAYLKSFSTYRACRRWVAKMIEGGKAR